MNTSYLLIRNRGLAPIEAFTVLGLSTARGQADLIGQFGSGSKHGILTLMRAGISFAIFIGNDRLEFYTVEASMNGTPYKEVRYRWQGEDHKTGMCLEFGALDWGQVGMSLREFICNALDQGEKIDRCALAIDCMESVPDETRIYVEMTQPVYDYATKLRDYFLHFDQQEAVEIIPARSKVAEFFRRGVYVTATGDEKRPALFAYNFLEGKIDESRNLDGASLTSIAARLLVESKECLQRVLESFAGETRWEHSIGSAMYFACGLEHKPAVQETWRTVFTDRPYADNPEVSEKLTAKNIEHVVVPPGWSGFLDYADIANGRKLLSGLDMISAVECEATESAIETFRRCWRWLEAARLTGDKSFPQVRCFTLPMKQGVDRMGYYRNGTVFLNLDNDTSEQTALEELSHYITGALDETRDFQDFAFRLATRLAKLRDPRVFVVEAPAPVAPPPVERAEDEILF